MERRVNGREEEARSGEALTMGDLGFVDRKHNVGLTTAPIRLHTTVDPKDSARVFFAVIDYPVNGLGLEHLQTSVAPKPAYADSHGNRIATLPDWRSPDAFDIAYDAELDRRHRSMRAFREFDAHHRKKWINVSNRREFDKMFVWRDTTAFVDAERFVIAELEERIRLRQGHVYSWQKRDTLSDFYDLDKEFVGAFHSRYGYYGRLGVGDPIREVIDPVRGLKVSDKEAEIAFDSAEFTKIEPSGLEVVHYEPHITAEIQLGEYDELGFYSEERVTFTPDALYKKDSLRPAIAWKERHGGRLFLSQPELEALLPPELRQGGEDVFLGRVALAYLQEDVTSTFPQVLPIPAFADGKEQDMGTAQLPVMVSMPQYARSLLNSDKVSGLQVHIRDSIKDTETEIEDERTLSERAGSKKH